MLASLTGALIRYMLVMGNILKILKLLSPYLSTFLLFIAFLLINGGVVVGDRSSHQAVFHLAQLLHCSLSLLIFAFPLLVTPSKLVRFSQFLKSHASLAFILVTCFSYALQRFSVVHPYLLADTRHYAFYLHKNLLSRPLLRLVLLPAYLYSAWSLNDSLRRKSVLWRLVYLVSVSMVTVPAALLELRYFAMPYLMFRLNVKAESKRQAFLELGYFLAVNFVTVAVFAMKTFYWADVEGPQRIIW